MQALRRGASFAALYLMNASSARALSTGRLPLTRLLVPDLLDAGEAAAEDPAGTLVLDNFATPGEVEAAFAASGVPIALDGHAHDAEALRAACATTLQYSVKTRHPLFLNQLYGGVDDASLAGEWLVCAANTNAHTYEVAPVFTLVEREVVRRVGELAGWGAGTDGLTTPGGSASNLYAVHMAAHAADPGRRTRGAAGGPVLCAFVSADAHYSYLKASRVMGLGDDNVVAVPVDAAGRMRGPALAAAMAQARAEGKTPFFVGSTAGTTVRGSFDAVGEIQDVVDAAPEELWHHVDGSWGASALWDAAAKDEFLPDLERTDSFVVNAHKLMNAAIACSVFVSAPKRQGMLVKTNAAAASYLFQPDKANADLDTGDKTIQCGRRPDAFKLWLMWKALGDEGMQQRVRRCLDIAEHVRRRVDESGGALEPALDGGCFANVLFRVVPPRLRGARDAAQEAELGAAQPKIKAAMQAGGDALIGFQAYGDEVNFFRLVITQANTLTEELMDKTLDTMVAYAEAL